DAAHPKPPAVAVPAPPASDAVARVTKLLAQARRPLLLIGSQATQDVPRVPELVRAVAALGVPAYLSGMARGLLGRDHPLLLRPRRKEALKGADLVLLAGVPADFRLNYGRDFASGARLVMLNNSGADLRKNVRPHVAALGDPGAFL